MSFIQSAFPFGMADAKGLKYFPRLWVWPHLTAWFYVFWSFMYPYSKTEILIVSFLEYGEKKGKVESSTEIWVWTELLLNFSKMGQNMADALKWNLLYNKHKLSQQNWNYRASGWQGG